MRNLSILLFVIVTFSFSCSHQKRINNEFASKTRHHKLVAVLPFEVEHTGKKPKDLTDELLKSIIHRESQDFQSSLISNLSEKNHRKNKSLKVTLQSSSMTNSQLEKAGISIEKSYLEDPVRLCKILNVDAIIKPKIVIKRYLSNLESFGIDFANRLIWSTSPPNSLFMTGFQSRTNDITVQIDIIDSIRGDNLYSRRYITTSDWRDSYENQVDCINGYLAQRLPYLRR